MHAKKLALLLATLPAVGIAQQPNPWLKEVVYQIFERSFFDSNGDRIGDFKGIEQKLPYIKSLGATTILLQPIAKSRFYHNYFADDFLSADPSLGGTDEFFELVRAAHQNRLKVVIDMEPQYVGSEHPWFKAGPPRVVENSGIYGIRELPVYTGGRIGVETVNLMNPKNIVEIRKVFEFWAAPGGNAKDGVDGFRIDHMMDDLDDRHVNTNLLAGFWAPIEADIRKLKPDIFFVAEQSDWKSLGEPQLGPGAVDAVYAIPLRFALVDAVQKGTAVGLFGALKNEQAATPESKTQLVVAEDHDVVRWASVVHGDPQLERLAAVFQTVVKGTPSLYYGQELGVRGEQLHGRSDGNDIPIRLAMPWTTSPSSGEANWYGEGPWLQDPEVRQNEGISVEREDRDPASLLNFYRKCLRLRRSLNALTVGDQTILDLGNPAVLAVLRQTAKENIFGMMNFSATPQTVRLPDLRGKRTFELLTHRRIEWHVDQSIEIPSHGFLLFADKR